MRLLENLIALRRDLHRHPELSGQEHRTAARIEEALRALGLQPARVAGTGVVAEIGQGLPVIALRADMDALPITEETGLPFASETPGVMHACAHDGHTAMLVGAAELLAAGDALPCRVRLVFQPAEEHGTGAPSLIAAGVLDDVAAIFGGHIDRLYDVGRIVVTDGPLNASTDEFVVGFHGPGGHGARPQETSDPIVAGAAFVMSLQTIVAREIHPAHAAVVSVGRFDAGAAPNVIATRARIEGTLRALLPEVRAHLRAAVRRHAESVAGAHRVAYEVTIHEGTPPVVNREPWVSVARAAAQRVVGAGGIATLDAANLGGEDFGFYLERVPGCYVRFGARPDGESHPAHSPRFVWDEGVLEVGARYLAEVAVEAGRRLAQHPRG